jgi:hypothetical protein
LKTRSYLHRGGEPALVGRTIPEHVAEIAALFPAGEAVDSIHQNRRLTYAEPWRVGMVSVPTRKMPPNANTILGS